MAKILEGAVFIICGFMLGLMINYLVDMRKEDFPNKEMVNKNFKELYMDCQYKKLYEECKNE